MWRNVAQHLNLLLGVHREYKITPQQEAVSRYLEHILKNTQEVYDGSVVEYEKGSCETQNLFYEFSVSRVREEIFFARTIEQYTNLKDEPLDVAAIVGIEDKILVNYFSTREISPTKYKGRLACKTIDFTLELYDIDIDYEEITTVVKKVDWELRVNLDRAGDCTLSRTAQAVPAMLNDVLLALYWAKEKEFENSLLLVQ